MGRSSEDAALERDWVQGSELDRRLARCRERLAGVAPLNLPLDHPRPARQQSPGSMLPIAVDSATGRRLRKIAADHDATLFQLLAAVYAYWLRSYTEQDDVVFATVHDLRQGPRLESMVGHYLTPVVLRISVAETSTCIGLLTRMRTEILDAVGCAVPFERLIRAIDPPPDERQNPLFQTALVLAPSMLGPDSTCSIHQVETAVGALVGQSKLDISVELDERSDGRICGRLIYNTHLFETSTVQLMRSHFVRLLRNVVPAPDLPLAELSGPDEQDRHRQLSEFNPKPLPATFTQDRCIHELIVDQVTRTPDAVAVVVGDQKLSYRDLLGRSQQIAARLTAAGAGPGVVVAICVDRSIELVPALLGVLLSGAAYLPLDLDQPESRSLFMIADAGATLLLTDSIHRLRAAPSDIEVVDLAHDATCSNDTVPVSIPGNCTPQDLAYVIYTSGSTGTAKGVLVEHRSVVNLMMAMPGALGLSEEDTHVSVVSYAFDGSVGDIFVTLALGATLVLATGAQTKDPRELAELVECCEATVMSATPTTWSMLIGAGWTGRPGFLAVCGGEPLSDRLARELRQRCRAVWNGWGPTEATVFAGGGFVEAGEPITVGRPLPGVRIYVMDNPGRLVACGVPGEIVIAGRGISRGYLNRPEETARRYRLDPFVDGERMYRSGDRGRLLADGRLQHLGRNDNQVKIRGFRIELGEIESVLIEHPNVREVAAGVRRDDVGQQQLVAYVVTATGGIDNAQLRRWAQGRLPAYMVPRVIVQLSALPMSPGGKLDRAALPASPALAAPSRAIPAETELETTTQRHLAELWSELLPGTAEGSHRDFFELGGDSVLATRLLVELERRFGISVAVADFLQHGTTLADLGALVDRTQVSGVGITPQRVEQSRLFFVYPDLTSSMSMRHLSKVLKRDHRVHPLITPLPLGRIGRSLTLEEMAKPLLRTIHAAQPEGPYRLIGYSFGGLLTYELGRLLHADGEQVAWLGLLDTPTPAKTRLMMRNWKSPSGRMAVLRTAGWSKVITKRGHNLRWSAREALIAAGLARRRPGEQFDARHAWKIMLGCTIDGHDLPMKLFVTTDTVKKTGSDSLGWADVHNGPLEIHAAPGDHVSLLSETFAGEFTALLSTSLYDGSPEPQTIAAAEGLTR